MVSNVQTPLVPSIAVITVVLSCPLLSAPPTVQDTFMYRALRSVSCQSLNLKQVSVFLYHLC